MGRKSLSARGSAPARFLPLGGLLLLEQRRRRQRLHFRAGRGGRERCVAHRGFERNRSGRRDRRGSRGRRRSSRGGRCRRHGGCNRRGWCARGLRPGRCRGIRPAATNATARSRRRPRPGWAGKCRPTRKWSQDIAQIMGRPRVIGKRAVSRSVTNLQDRAGLDETSTRKLQTRSCALDSANRNEHHARNAWNFAKASLDPDL